MRNIISKAFSLTIVIGKHSTIVLMVQYSTVVPGMLLTTRLMGRFITVASGMPLTSPLMAPSTIVRMNGQSSQLPLTALSLMEVPGKF